MDNVVDMVNHPDHYTSGKVECIEGIEAALTPIQYCGYLRGNVMKYLWRCERKANMLEDLKKAQWYLNRLVEYAESHPNEHLSPYIRLDGESIDQIAFCATPEFVKDSVDRFNRSQNEHSN